MQSTKLKKLQNDYLNHKLSHAYLIETNNYDDCLNDLKKLVKLVCCNTSYSEECSNCNICHLIDKEEFPNYIIIKPDGTNIKKEQILNLKNRLNFKPIYSNNFVYVIVGAEKLNLYSSNTMLKMIEEPFDNIYGFFLTNNKENIINTIKSRCEIIKNYYFNDSYTIINDKDAFDKMAKVAYDYLEHLEIEKRNILLYNKNILFANYTEKNDIELFLKFLFEIYNNVFRKMMGLEHNKVFDGYDFLEKKDINTIKKKLFLISTYINNIKYNFNLDLLLDKFVIEMSEING